MGRRDEYDLRCYSFEPPMPGACPTCAAFHNPSEPHNRNSLYYQMHFRKKYRRYPTWEDAMSHCNEQTKRVWRAKLAMLGVMSEDTMKDG